MSPPPKKTKATVVRAKLKPEGAMTVLFTLRDAWGTPIPQMKMTMSQVGTPLKAVGGGDILTDDKGRITIDKVMPEIPLSIALDDKYLPPDPEDARKTQYTYTLAKQDDVIELDVENDDDKKLTFVDTQRAYATLFASVDLFRPKYRFPWQNPYHSENVERIYGKRVKNLQYVLRSLFGVSKSEADSMGHAALVSDLIRRYQASQAAVPAASPQTMVAPPAGPPDLTMGHAVPPGTGSDPEPAPPSEPAPASAPVPPSEPAPAPPVQSATRPLPITDATAAPAPPTPAPAPNPPANVPSASAVDKPELPRWVWYLIFHHSGLQYSPVEQRGAHQCCVKPGFILKAMRLNELEASFGKNAPAAASDDVTEALALIERGIIAKTVAAKQKPNLLSGDAAKTKAALIAIFTSICNTEMARLDDFRTADNVYDGDYVALGLLKAKRIKSSAVLTDAVWKIVASRTQLRNDTTGTFFETIAESARPLSQLGAFATLMKPIAGAALDGGQWRDRRAKTLDTLLSAAVCDQTTETGELIRSGNIGNGIPADAKKTKPLHYVSFTSAKTIRRGMHMFYLAFQPFKSDGGEQEFVSFANTESNLVPCRAPDPQDPKATILELKPMSTLKTITNLSELLDPNDGENKTREAKNDLAMRKEDLRKRANADPTLMKDPAFLKELWTVNNPKPDAKKASPPGPLPGPQSLTPTVIIAKDKKFDDTRLIDARLVGNARISDKEERLVAVRCQGRPDGTAELTVCKWYHEEIVVNVKVEAKNVVVQLFSTSSSASAEEKPGTGIRVYNFADKDKYGREANNYGSLFGFEFPTEKENILLLDAVYLNPKLLTI